MQPEVASHTDPLVTLLVPVEQVCPSQRRRSLADLLQLAQAPCTNGYVRERLHEVSARLLRAVVGGRRSYCPHMSAGFAPIGSSVDERRHRLLPDACPYPDRAPPSIACGRSALFATAEQTQQSFGEALYGLRVGHRQP